MTKTRGCPSDYNPEMPFEVALTIAGVVLVATFIVVVSVVAARRAAAVDEERKHQASMRGWSYESAREKGYTVHRWKGATDGVEWSAESRYKPGGHGHAPVKRTRWLAADARGPERPILCVGAKAGAVTATLTLGDGDGMIANLARKAATFAFDKAVDSYFGEEIAGGVDAKQLKPVPGTTVPGYTIMAADTDEAARILFQGLTKALSASPPPAVKSEEGKGPWVLLWKGGVAVGKAEVLDSTDELEWMARLGSSVARLPLTIS